MATWVVVCDASQARIFEARGRGRLLLVRELNHPEARVPGHELATDRPGRMQQSNGHTRRSAIDPRTAAREIQLERFAAELADELRTGWAQNIFSQLVLVAPPHFLGRLRSRLDPHVARHVIGSVNKDLTAQDDQELAETLGEQLLMA